MALGITAEEAGRRISAAELAEWAAFEFLEGPILLHERIDLAAGLIQLRIAQSVSDGKRRLRLKDFMPRWERAQPPDLLAFFQTEARKGKE